MTYSILARDAQTGEMGVATQSQAFAVGHSVPWAMSGFGVIATQSMGEPAYGELGLEALRAGLTASETLTALRSIDAHPERRQVAMIDVRGNIAAYTGQKCIGKAGHQVGHNCCAVANMMSSERVWDVMIDTFVSARGPLASRLMAALHAAEAHGGDFRGKRSAALRVVRADRSGRPWRDNVVDLRVDCHDDPLAALTVNDRYNRMVSALERALDGDPVASADQVERLEFDPAREPDLFAWRAVIYALAGREQEAVQALCRLRAAAPPFFEVFRQFGVTELVHAPALWSRLLARVEAASDARQLPPP
jgi:uncharacterized Ntn-hydrolase superfamily protein